MADALSGHFTVPRLLKYALAPVLMMIFTSIYGVVDGFFVSNFVGKIPFAAVNLVMPVAMILGGLGFMTGTGGSALVAKTLGQGRVNTAKRYFTEIVAFTLVLGLAAAGLGAAFIRPISIGLGATPAMLEDCVTYGRILILFVPAFMLQNVFQTFFSTSGKPQLGLYVTVASGLTNMVLDALFIAVFSMGVFGAALATGISQLVGALVPLVYFARPNDSLLHFVRPGFEPRVLGRVCYNGVSELMTNISMSLVSMVYNWQLLRFAGEDGVAAYGVIMYVSFVFVAVFIGYTVGAAPLVAYNYGAQDHAELKSLLVKSLKLVLAGGLVMMVLGKVLAGPLSQVFTGYDAGLCALTTHAMTVYAWSFVLSGVNIFYSSFFTALNNGAVSAAISFMRTLVFELAFVILLPLVFGLEGIWWAITCAEISAAFIGTGFIFKLAPTYGYLEG